MQFSVSVLVWWSVLKGLYSIYEIGQCIPVVEVLHIRGKGSVQFSVSCLV